MRGATARRARPPDRSSAPRWRAAAAAGPASTAARRTPSAVSRPLIPFAARPNSTALSTSVCGRVVRGDRVGRAVEQGGKAGRGVLGRAQRRVDAQRRMRTAPAVIASSAHGSPLGLPGPAPGARDPLVGQRQVMGRDVAGDRQAGRLGAPDELQRAAGREVGEVQAGRPARPAGRRRGSRGPVRPPSPRPRPASRAAPAPSPRTRRSPRRRRSATAPRHGRRSAARARPHTPAPPAGSSADRTGDPSSEKPTTPGVGQLAERGQLLPCPPERHRADARAARPATRRPTAAARTPARTPGSSRAGRRVRHRADRREPAVRRRREPARDRLGILVARLAQVGVEVDEPGRDDDPVRPDAVGVRARQPGDGLEDPVARRRSRPVPRDPPPGRPARPG